MCQFCFLSTLLWAVVLYPCAATPFANLAMSTSYHKTKWMSKHVEKSSCELLLCRDTSQVCRVSTNIDQKPDLHTWSPRTISGFYAILLFISCWFLCCIYNFKELMGCSNTQYKRFLRTSSCIVMPWFVHIAKSCLILTSQWASPSLPIVNHYHYTEK